eukprot:3203336-Amphidinium_carterae.1
MAEVRWKCLRSDGNVAQGSQMPCSAVFWGSRAPKWPVSPKCLVLQLLWGAQCPQIPSEAQWRLNRLTGGLIEQRLNRGSRVAQYRLFSLNTGSSEA